MIDLELVLIPAVPIDRAATLRNAEKLVRQGRLDQAIAEYLRAAEEQPDDWATANTLGDLYARTGQLDRAVERFTRIADSLADQGFLPKASALYKKVLKLRPDHEYALLGAARIARTQGLVADARGYLTAVIELCRHRHDSRGAAEARLRLAALDRTDFVARLDGARAHVELGDADSALRELKSAAADLGDGGRHAEAIEALREAAVLAPADHEIHDRLLDVYIAAGDVERARACAATPVHFERLASMLDARGESGPAAAARREAARLSSSAGEPGFAHQGDRATLDDVRAIASYPGPSPQDDEALLDEVRAIAEYPSSGAGEDNAAPDDVRAIAEYRSPSQEGDDAEMMLATAALQIHAERADEGLALLGRLLERHPDRHEQVAALGWTLGEERPELGFSIADLAARTAVASGDWVSAAAALQEFVTRVPTHIPALLHLVEISVDGGLEAAMYDAQAQLADAYLAAGLAAEARFIAEDLVAREPWEPVHIERLRQALELSGEPDPASIIADRLSGDRPLASTDLFPVRDDVRAPTEARVDPPGEPAAPPAADRAAPTASPVDVQSLLDELDAPSPPVHATSESVEVDLSIVLDQDRGSQPGRLPPQSQEQDLESVFERLRAEAQGSSLDMCEEHYKLGLALREEGDVDGCIEALQAASRAPWLRFASAALLGRLFRERGMLAHAVDWYERAAESPAPSPGEAHELLYELAEALEEYGEIARALAVCLELQADAGAYRDLAQRIDWLRKVQARG